LVVSRKELKNPTDLKNLHPVRALAVEKIGANSETKTKELLEVDSRMVQKFDRIICD
jgi:hypothetical protein